MHLQILHVTLFSAKQNYIIIQKIQFLILYNNKVLNILCVRLVQEMLSPFRLQQSD